MGVPESDWKNQPTQILDWVILGIGVGLLAIYLSLWWVEQLAQYLGIADILVAGGFIYFTDYWQPVLYLVLSIFLLVLMVFWIITGSWRQLPIQVASGLNIIFIFLGIFLFFREEAYGTKKDQT